jgi:hypothetical protein
MALEEERRLFYVAMTRAMKKLYITYAKSRMLYGAIRFNDPGRFIYEIPAPYCLRKNFKGERFDSSSSSISPSNQTRSLLHAPKKQPLFSPPTRSLRQKPPILTILAILPVHPTPLAPFEKASTSHMLSMVLDAFFKLKGMVTAKRSGLNSPMELKKNLYFVKN